MVAKDESKELDSLISLAIQLDICLQEHHRKNQGHFPQSQLTIPHLQSPSTWAPSPSQVSVVTAHDVESMRLSWSCLSPLEGSQRHKPWLYIYCGQADHSISGTELSCLASEERLTSSSGDSRESQAQTPCSPSSLTIPNHTQLQPDLATPASSCRFWC